MPVYEYEPQDRDCLMCAGRVDALQEVTEDPLRFCPYCGLEVRRVVSKATIKIAGVIAEDKAAKKGFTTWRRAQTGVWEKTAGEGPDIIAGTDTDIAAVESERNPPKILDLDTPI